MGECNDDYDLSLFFVDTALPTRFGLPHPAAPQVAQAYS